MNRFFYKCPRCLFKFAVDSDLRWGPAIGPCPICECDHIKSLGATKGVLTMSTKCNDVCTFANGPLCSCSCHGKNHGSRIVVPVINKVIQLDESRFPTAAETRRKWIAFRSTMEALKAGGVPPALRAWEWQDALADIRRGGDYRIRDTRIAALCQRIGLPVPSVAPVVLPSPGVAPGAVSAPAREQLFLF